MLAAGVTFDRYTIEALLGEGGMARVYVAYDPRLRRRVALKVVRTELDAPRTLAQRLTREAFAAAALNHPNIVAVYDVGEANGGPFFSMELVSGRTLRSFIGDQRVSVETRVRWLADVARALAAAHACGIVHRDVKPSNVMVRDDGVVKVLDFGIARTTDPEVSGSSSRRPLELPDRRHQLDPLTEQGKRIGTPRYMAPEQLCGATVDGRADQFSWGVVAYELLTGELSWATSDNTGAMEANVLLTVPVAPRTKVPSVPDHVEAIVLRALQKSPADRFASMAALLDALERGPAVEAAPSGREVRGRGTATEEATIVEAGGTRRLKLPRVRRAWMVLGAAGTIVVAAAGAWRLRAATSPSRGGGPASAASEQSTTGRAGAVDLVPEAARRITFGEGCQEFPSFTPDGQAVAYDGTVGPDSFIYWLDTSGNAPPRQLTKVRGWDLKASTSPAGDRIAFLRISDGPTAAYVVPIDGHQEPRKIAEGDAWPSWSPDGKAIWAGTAGALTRYEVDTGAALRTVSVPVPDAVAQTRELPDGRLVVEVSRSGMAGGIAVVDGDGHSRWLLHDRAEDWLAITSDERNAVTARDTATNAPELLEVPLDGAPVSALPTHGLDVGKGLALSSDGRRMAWSTCRGVVEVSVVDAAGQLVSSALGEQKDALAIAAIPGSHQLAVVCQRTGPALPWIFDARGQSAPRSLTLGSLDSRDLAISPDGRLAAVATTSGIHLVPLDGNGEGPPRKLTADASDDSPSFRADGKEILFTRLGADGLVRVFAASVDGATVRPFLEPGSDFPGASPVDERVVYLSGPSVRDAVPTLWDGRTGLRHALSPALVHGRYSRPSFTRDGKRVAIVYAGRDLLEVDAGSGAILRRVTTPEGDLLRAPTYTQDGLVVLRTRWRGNLWVADLAR